MLWIYVLISMFWGLCSTCLVRPMFWKEVINKEIFNGEDKKGYISIQLLLFSVNTGISFIAYYGLGCRLNLWGSFPMIIFALISQMIWEGQETFDKVCIVIVAISCLLWLQDGLVGQDIHMPKTERNIEITISNLKKEQHATDVNFNLLVAPEVVQTLFGAQKAKGPQLHNGKYIFVLYGGDMGDGVVVIDENDTMAHFISISCKPEVSAIRGFYPFTKIKEAGTYVVENTPYELFFIAKKHGVLGEYKVTGFIMLNLKNGSTEEFSLEDLNKLQERLGERIS